MELMETPLIIYVHFVRFAQPAQLVPPIALLVAQDYIYIIMIVYQLVQTISLRKVLIIHVVLVMQHVSHVKMKLLITVKHVKQILFTLLHRNHVWMYVPKIIIITVLILKNASNAYQVARIAQLPQYVNHVW
jgi:hypothetical protein